MKGYIALKNQVLFKLNAAIKLCFRAAVAHATFYAPLVILLFISNYIVGCGAQLGSIEPMDVESAILQAETAIESAHEANAPSLAPDAFAAAQGKLTDAKTALTDKNGSEALRLAYQAFADAMLAHRQAINAEKNAELNAQILEKGIAANKLSQQLSSKAEELATAQKQVQQLRLDEKQLLQTLNQLEKEKRELSSNQQTYKKQVGTLRENLEGIQTRAQRMESEIRGYGKEIAELRHKLEVADSMIREEGQQKRAVIAEMESLRKQLREQAQIYTEKLEKANQRSAAAAHEDYLKQKAREARAYVQSQQQNQPVRTGRTSLSTEQITAGKAALSRWDTAWSRKNLTTHLTYYAPNSITDKVVIRESKENRSKIDRGQLEANLREMNAHTWNKNSARTEVEGESVIGIYRMSRLVKEAADENATALYNIWIREVWMHTVGNEWKIHNERWQIYEDVPNF